MGSRVVGAAVRIDDNIGVRLVDGNRRRTALVEVIGATLEVPRADAAGGVSEADSKC